MKSGLTKIVAVLFIVVLGWCGLSATHGTVASFNDTETSTGNTYTAASLGFSVQTSGFSPRVTPTRNATATIDLTNTGILDFAYSAKVENATGTLCSSLELTDTLTDTFHPLTGFVSATTTFSATSSPLFTARLTSGDASLRTTRCTFTFVLVGVQLEGAGFSDRQDVEETISAGQWGPNVVINKVYYDPDSNHSASPSSHANEFIELYNASDQGIDIAGWTIVDNDAMDTLPAASPLIVPANGYALVSGSSTTWQYWEIPEGVMKIVLADGSIGGGLANDADMLVVGDALGNIVDQMNWGAPDLAWPNYNVGVWTPGVPDAVTGHMLGRVPSGHDTDQPSDFRDLALPAVAVTYPNGGEVFYVGDTYTLNWTAINPNGANGDLKINLYYSGDSGATWAKFASSTENDGAYDWRIPLFIDAYYVPSPWARIKAEAIGPENFMVQAWDMSDSNFCPPIDYGMLTPEEVEQLEKIKSGEIVVPDRGPELLGSESSSTDTVYGGGAIDDAAATDSTASMDPPLAETVLLTGQAGLGQENSTQTTTIDIATTTDVLDIEQPALDPADQEWVLTAPAIEEQPAIQEDPVVAPSEDESANTPEGSTDTESGGAPTSDAPQSTSE